MTSLLLYSAKAEHDALGHAIAWFEHGTFTHAALGRGGLVVEAVWPRVQVLTTQQSRLAIEGASEIIPLRPYSEELDVTVWGDLLMRYMWTVLIIGRIDRMLEHATPAAAAPHRRHIYNVMHAM